MKKYKWQICIGLAAFCLFLFNVFIFLPGYMSSDSIYQLYQAKGIYHISDWSPPAMVLIWRFLIYITGHISSMLFLQLSLEWLGIFCISVYVYVSTKSKKMSVMTLLIGLLPFILCVSGVLWKDILMANLTAFAMILIFTLRYDYRKVYRIITLTLALLLICVAVMLRYNFIFASIPLVYLGLRSYGGIFARKSVMAVSLFSIFFAIVGSVYLVNSQFNVEKSNPISAVMLDDIINTRSKNEIENAELPIVLKNSLADVQSNCLGNKILIDSLMVCSNDRQRMQISVTNFSYIKRYWANSLLDHPFKYISYKVETFILFIFTPDEHSYVWQDGIIDNGLGQIVRFKRAGAMMRVFIIDFGYRYFSFIFKPWFWLIAAVILIRLSKRFERIRLYIKILCISAIVYIFSYFPFVEACDYRYIYWSVLAVLISLVVYLVERTRLKKLENK